MTPVPEIRLRSQDDRLRSQDDRLRLPDDRLRLPDDRLRMPDVRRRSREPGGRARQRRQRSQDERGSATVVMLAVIAVVLMLTVSGLMLASAVLASHRARASADLAALAAAGALIRGESPAAACQAAARVAEANHGRLQRCGEIGTDVRLSIAVPAGLKGLGVATARSRAGPGPTGGLSVTR